MGTAGASAEACLQRVRSEMSERADHEHAGTAGSADPVDAELYTMLFRAQLLMMMTTAVDGVRLPPPRH
jgi:hypothetical protein